MHFGGIEPLVDFLEKWVSTVIPFTRILYDVLLYIFLKMWILDMENNKKKNINK